jgi:FKBP-type peptidyl-prolyl cis-trans isomerase SlyD
MEKVRKDLVIGFTYNLTDGEGNLIDQSDDVPLEYIHGYNHIVTGLETQLEGRGIGDKLKVIVNPADGYGEFNADLIITADRTEFGDIEDLEEGMLVQSATEDGEEHVLRVVEIGNDIVKLDGNHPLAGMTLHFDVEVVSIRQPTKQELAHGHVHHDGHDHH